MDPPHEAVDETAESVNPLCGVPTLSEGGSHSQILLWKVPIAFFFRLHESSNPRPQGPILKWGALSLPTELAQLVVRVLPTSI